MLCHPEPGSAVSYALRNAKSPLTGWGTCREEPGRRVRSRFHGDGPWTRITCLAQGVSARRVV